MYSSIMSVLPVETSGLVRVNMLLLFFVSIEPYLFNELFTLQGEMLYNAFIIYALDLAAMFLIMAFFSHYVADEEKKLVPKSLVKNYEFRRNFYLLIGAIFIISTAPIFGSVIVLHTMIGEKQYDIPLRIFVWWFALILGVSRRSLERVIES